MNDQLKYNTMTFFAGSVQAMITSLKNNSRNRKSIYDKKDALGTGSKISSDFPESTITPEELLAFSKLMRKKRRQRDMVIAVTAVFSLAVTYFLIRY